MIYYASTRRGRDRLASAMLAFTGYQPPIYWEQFLLDKRGAWRIQDDSIGNEWGSRIKCYLDAGKPASRATQERVAAHCNKDSHE